MSFGVPISVALAGYLWAIGAASVPLRATLVGIPATLAASPGAAPLPRRRREWGLRTSRVPWSSLSSSFTQRGVRRPSGSALAWPSPWCVATVSASCGWLVARWIGPDLAGALSSSAVAVGLFVGGLAAVHRADLADAWTLIGRGLRGVVATPTDPRTATAAGDTMTLCHRGRAPRGEPTSLTWRPPLCGAGWRRQEPSRYGIHIVRPTQPKRTGMQLTRRFASVAAVSLPIAAAVVVPGASFGSSSGSSGLTAHVRPQILKASARPHLLVPHRLAARRLSRSAVKAGTLTISSGRRASRRTKSEFVWKDCNTHAVRCKTITQAAKRSYKLGANDVGDAHHRAGHRDPRGQCQTPS